MYNLTAKQQRPILKTVRRVIRTIGIQHIQYSVRKLPSSMAGIINK